MTAKAVLKLIEITPSEDSRIELIQAYAANCIKKDRKNIVKYADIEYSYGFGSTSCTLKKDSILNAPNIELP